MQLQKELGGSNPEMQKELQLVYRTAPIAWLEVEASRQGLANVIAKARTKALLDQFAGEEREDIEDLVLPEHSAMNVLQVRIAGPLPDRVWIDGLSFSPVEVIDKTLTMAAIKHSIIATAGSSVAVSFFGPYSDGQVASVQLQFRISPSPNVEKVEEARKGRKWLEVVAATTDENLQPRNAAIALYHWEALHRLGWDSSIVVKDWNWIPAEDWQRLLDWQRKGQPLASWY
jgi:hypothetical protein